MKRATILPKLALAFALTAATFSVTSKTEADPGCKKVHNPICPAIFDPVTCDNNQTYTNSCFAQADCATGCVPAGGV